MSDKWSYGVMTVPSRTDLLKRTLNSLRGSGFDRPHLFVDGSANGLLFMTELGLQSTCRMPAVGVAGNWVLSLYELYYRNPQAEHFLLFQDDLVVCRNLKLYLENCPRPENSYLNLYTSRSNEKVVPKEGGKPKEGWYASNQLGRGALALLFDKKSIVHLFSSQHLAMRPQCVVRGHRSIDGGVLNAMHDMGYKEHVHHPSLIQHTGDDSTIGNPSKRFSEHFRGESFDPLILLRGAK